MHSDIWQFIVKLLPSPHYLMTSHRSSSMLFVNVNHTRITIQKFSAGTLWVFLSILINMFLQHQTYVSIVYKLSTTSDMCPLSTTSDICVHCLQHQTYVSIVYNIRHMCPLSTTSDICVHISILAIFSMSFGFHAPKDLLIIWLSNILTLSVPDEVYFRKVSYTLLYTVFMVFFVIWQEYALEIVTF